MAKKTDQKTLDLIKEVKKRRAEISSLERSVRLTNCSFSYVEGKLTDVVNLNAVSDVKTLIEIAAFLAEKKRSYQEAATFLQVESAPKFTWSGFSVEDWVEDIKNRINKIQIASKQRKLQELETRLNAIISPELRAELEIEAIAGELG